MFDSMPAEYSMSFVMPYDKWGAWMTWVNQNGYTWFDIEIPNHVAAAAGGSLCKGTGEIRFISDINWSVIGEDSVKATVAAELKV